LLSILLRKYWIMRRRHIIILTLFELFSPLLIAIIIQSLYIMLILKYHNKSQNGKTKGPVVYKNPVMNINFEISSLDFIARIYYTPDNRFTNDLMNRINNFSYKSIEIISLNDSFELKTKLK
jgi:hypothetical protein